MMWLSSLQPTPIRGNGWTLPLGCGMVIMSSVHSGSGPGRRRLFGSSGQALAGAGPVSSRHRQAGTEAGTPGALDCMCHGRRPGAGLRHVAVGNPAWHPGLDYPDGLVALGLPLAEARAPGNEPRE